MPPKTEKKTKANPPTPKRGTKRPLGHGEGTPRQLHRGTTPENLLDNIGNPKVPCRKCNGKLWVPDLQKLSWGCPQCGNRTYFIYGVLRQQIDSVMASHRKAEYVHSEDGLKIRARTSNDIRRIRAMAAKDRQDQQTNMERLRDKLNVQKAQTHSIESTAPIAQPAQPALAIQDVQNV